MEPRVYSDALIRRAAFILQEARLGDGRRDQAITMTMRVLSNHATVDSDAQSFGIKLRNRDRMSEGAAALLASDPKDFHKHTINEHPLPLKLIWRWMRDNADALSPEDVLEKFYTHPTVIVTKEEDKRLRELGKAAPDDPAERYAAAHVNMITPPASKSAD